MSEEQRVRVLHDWSIWGRPKQQFDPSNSMTVVTPGRGWGKTNAATEHCHKMAGEWKEKCGGIIGIAGRTHDDAVNDLIRGKAGILATQKPWNRCEFRGDQVFWENGSIGYILTGDKPSRFRGKNIGFLWCDEFVHWKYPKACYESFIFDIRNGTHPSILITTTPLPDETLIKIVNDQNTVRVIGHTRENALNIDPATLKKWMRLFGGTDLELQELGGEILAGSKHAPWQQGWIKRIETHELPVLSRIVLAIDPAGRKGKNSDNTGIVVAGIDDADDANTYVIADATDKYSPTEWAARAIHLARYHGAQRIVGETNYGGDMVMTIIRQHPDWPLAEADGIELVEVTATESKGNRAIAPAAMYQQGRGYHVGDPRKLALLEHQMTHFDSLVPRGRQSSPDAMDALVHAMADLHPTREGLTSSGQTDADVAEWSRFLRGAR